MWLPIVVIIRQTKIAIFDKIQYLIDNQTSVSPTASRDEAMARECYNFHSSYNNICTI